MIPNYHRCFFAALLALGLLVLAGSVRAETSPLALTAKVPPVDAPTSDRWIVVLKDPPTTGLLHSKRASQDRLGPVARRSALDSTAFHPLSARTHRLVFSPAVTASQVSSALASLRRDPDVAAIEPDYRVQHHAATPNDPGYSDQQYSSSQPVGQWYLKANSGEVRSAINAQGAWPFSQGDASVVIAVLDTGILFEHPDLMRSAAGGRLLPGYDFVSADSNGGFVRANDGDGWDDDPSDPGDWVDDALLTNHPDSLSGCSTDKSSWHGTRTSALVGSLSQNGVGIAGVDWRARLLPVRVLGRCGGYTSDIVAGLRWAGGLPVDGVPNNPFPANVINLSLGHNGPCSFAEQATIDELSARGVVVVASAGNDQGAVESPGNCRGVIAVAGLRHTGTKVGFSSFGPQVAISAPGGNCVNVGAQQPCLYSIDTATNAGTTTPAEHIYTTQLNSNVGTSFAAPQVAGVAGLLLAVNPSLSPAQVRSAIQLSANPFPVEPGLPNCPLLANGETNVGQCNCIVGQCGAGMLNAQAAVQRVNPAECFFNWAERSAPYLFPGGPTSQTFDSYNYRHYTGLDHYLAIAGDSGHVLYLNPRGLTDLGVRAGWFAQAGCLQVERSSDFAAKTLQSQGN